MATVRFDVADATAKADVTDVEHWHVTIDDGDVAVTREPLPAEAVVRIARPYLEAIVTGRLNAAGRHAARPAGLSRAASPR